MSEKLEITASIVLYNTDVKVVQTTVKSFLQIPLPKKLFLIDNSQKDTLKANFKHPEIDYFFTGKNVGFGKGHNQVIDKIKGNSKYHLVLNPDVVFKGEDVVTLCNELSQENNVAMISPKVIYTNGKLQYTCRKHPTFSDLAYRRLGVFRKRSALNEYRNLDLNKPFYPDFIHGCFMLFKTEDFVKINGFDERYFLYMEDADICKKIDAIGKRKKYFPAVSITHIYQKGSSKNLKLFFHHFLSAIKYMKKWKN